MVKKNWIMIAVEWIYVLDAEHTADTEYIALICVCHYSLFQFLNGQKKYYAECSSCGTVFSLNNAIGKRIEHGEQITLSSEDFEFTDFHNNPNKYCSRCGYIADSDFDYCPKCGTKL